jgi:hypothetical protein
MGWTIADSVIIADFVILSDAGDFHKMLEKEQRSDAGERRASPSEEEAMVL